jgi:hypothetical protein
MGDRTMVRKLNQSMPPVANGAGVDKCLIVVLISTAYRPEFHPLMQGITNSTVAFRTGHVAQAGLVALLLVELLLPTGSQCGCGMRN